MQAHGGELRVESGVGQGATFEVLLPAAAEPPRGDSPEAHPAPRGRVLIVDDDPRVAESMARLIAVDHEANIALAARPALEQLAASPDAFDVVLCDVRMPAMSGIELHGELAQLNPDVAARVVLITGGSLPRETEVFLRERGVLVLEKPIDLDALSELIRARVAARRGLQEAPP